MCLPEMSKSENALSFLSARLPTTVARKIKWLIRSNLGAVGDVAVEEDDPSSWNNGWLAWFKWMSKHTIKRDSICPRPRSGPRPR